jgi:hypothetical protein
MPDFNAAFSDLLPATAEPKAPDFANAFADLLPAQQQPASTPAAEGQPAKITVRPANSFLGYPQHYQEMRTQAQNDIGRGVEQIGSGLMSSTDENNSLQSAIEGIQKGQDIDYAVEQSSRPPSMPVPSPGMKVAAGVGNVVQGAAGYLYSPIGAGVRSMVSAPLEQRTGIPKEYPEFAAGLAIPLPKAVPRVAKAEAPTVAELKGAASAGYKSPEVRGVEIKSETLPQLSQKIRAELDSGLSIDETLAPKTFAILAKAEQAPAGSVVTVQNLESLRRKLGHAAGSGDKTERLAAIKAQRDIDDFLAHLPKGDVITGDAQAASAILKEARGNYSAAESALTLDRKTQRAELRAAAANSGQNVTNAMRQRMADILLSPSERRGFSSPELVMMERIVRGSKTENIIRGAGNFLGGGGGLGAMVTTAEGARALGPIGALAALPGAALKSLSNVMTARNIEKLNEMVRADSPLGRKVAAPLEDWSRIRAEAETTPTSRNIARLTLASRNLSTNLRDVGIEVAPDRLIRLQGPVGAGAEEEQPQPPGVVQ